MLVSPAPAVCWPHRGSPNLTVTGRIPRQLCLPKVGSQATPQGPQETPLSVSLEKALQGFVLRASGWERGLVASWPRALTCEASEEGVSLSRTCQNCCWFLSLLSSGMHFWRRNSFSVWHVLSLEFAENLHHARTFFMQKCSYLDLGVLFQL